MKKIKGFEKIYGERFQMGGIIWEVSDAGSHSSYIRFKLRIVDAGKRAGDITYRYITCFLDFYHQPTLEFWRDGSHMHTIELKPEYYESKSAFIRTIVAGMQTLHNESKL